jgi:hypothetical protein
MSSGIDYIPKGDLDLKVWTSLFLTSLGTMLDRVHFPSELYASLTALNDKYAQAFELATEPVSRTAVTVVGKNVARDALKKAVRQAVKEHLAYSQAVTNIDRQALGIPVHKAKHTPVHVAASYPIPDTECSTIRHLIIHFIDSELKGTKAKPAGQLGAEIVWAIRDTPPVDISDLIHSTFSTHTPATLEFREHERGKTVYFCLCWVNTRAKKGPWGQIRSAYIP